ARLLLLLLLGIVRRQIGRDAVPRLSVVARAEEELRADVDHALLRRTDRDRRVPVEAQLAFPVTRQRLEAADLVGSALDPADLAALRLRVDVAGVRGADVSAEAVAAVDVLPAAVRDPARILRVADPAAVVLESAVDAVRPVQVEAHVIELRHRQ